MKKPYAIFGSTPRGSKTSTKEIICGLPLFFHCNSSETNGNIVVYYNKLPFPRLFVSAGTTYWSCKEKAENFVKNNYLRIIDAISNLDKTYGIPRQQMDKLANGTDYDFEIVEFKDKKDGMRLRCGLDKELNEYYYLYTFDTKLSNDEIYEEWKFRRNKNG